MVTDQEEPMDDSKQWIELIDQGGLAKVTSDCYELFVAMEKELRNHLTMDQVPKLTETVKQKIIENDDVQFFWSIISGDWEEESGNVLLDMIITRFGDSFLLELGWKNTSVKEVNHSKIKKQLATTKT